MLYGAGFRISEAAAFQLADYDQDTGIITLRRDDDTTRRQVRATNGDKAHGCASGTLARVQLRGFDGTHSAVPTHLPSMRPGANAGINAQRMRVALEPMPGASMRPGANAGINPRKYGSAARLRSSSSIRLQ